MTLNEPLTCANDPYRPLLLQMAWRWSIVRSRSSCRPRCRPGTSGRFDDDHAASRSIQRATPMSLRAVG